MIWRKWSKIQMRHNKKRNTAFLYESLVKELTRAALQSDARSKKIIASILKEHFSVNSVLHKELNLYKTLCEVNSVSKPTAEKILVEVKRVYHTLGQDEIFDEQTEVIKKINAGLSKKMFSNFVSNYKTLATISQMFSSKTPISKRIVLEQKIIDLMTSGGQDFIKLKPIDNLTYKMFVQKFNEKYGTSLNENQKLLLTKYVTFSPDTALEFKVYINEEIRRLKESIKALQSINEVKQDYELSSKNKEILAILENFKSQQINDDMIKKILKIQALAAEA
jgi:hypothetical protein